MKDQFKKILLVMVNEKKLNGILKYDKKDYKLTLFKKNQVQNSSECYEGNVSSSNYDETFIYCISNEDSSLLFIKN